MAVSVNTVLDHLYRESPIAKAVGVTSGPVCSFHFAVLGDPQPQGSTKAFVIKGTNRAVVTSANSKNKPWRQDVSRSAMCAIRTSGFVPMMDGQAVELKVDFYFDKPKSTKKTVIHKTTRPDVDKLLRSVADALTGIAFKDDCQIVKCVATKHFGSPPRAVISVGIPIFTEETCESLF